MAADSIRILHVITGLGVGGAETMLTAMVTGDTPPDLEQAVVSLTPGGPNRKRLEAAGIAVSDLGMVRNLPSWEALKRLARQISAYKPHVIQSWMYHADLTALASLHLSGRRKETRLLWGIRCSDMDTSRYNLQLKAVIKLAARLSHLPEGIIANSLAGRDVHLRLGYHPRFMEVIPNGFNITRFQPSAEKRAAFRARLGLGPDIPLVAHTARVDPMKDQASFLRAMATMPDIHALLIGTGTEKLPPAPNVHLLGRREDVADILPAADVIVSSSLFGEGFSNALAEGMACGLPAVATDVGDARLVVGDSGLVVAPGDSNVLAAALKQMLVDERDALSARSHAARRHIVDNFAIDRIVSRFFEIYRRTPKCAA